MTPSPSDQPLQPLREGADIVTRQVLGVGSYLGRLNPRSEAARERLSTLASSPLLSREIWEVEMRRLRQLDEKITAETIGEIEGDLRALPTLERVFRCFDAGEKLRDADLFEVKRFLYHAACLLNCVEGADKLPDPDSDICALLNEAMATIHPESAPSARFHLADELDPLLARKRQELRQVRRKLKKVRSELEARVLLRTPGKFDIHGSFRPQGDPPVDEELLYWRDGAFCLQSERLSELQSQIEQLGIEVGELEKLQRSRLTTYLLEHRGEFEDLLETLLTFDLRLARVELRRSIDGCWPQMADDSSGCVLNLQEARDPNLVAAYGVDEVQPVDLDVKGGATMVLGPNMGGKSALLRLVGLSQWCAQMALPVPAKSCKFRQIRRVVYVGSEEPASGDVDPGLSSFGREVRRLMDFWEAPGPILWLLDEPGRGTHPEEGADLAARIVDERISAGDCLMVATHFPKLAAAPQFSRLRIKGLRVDDEELSRALSENGADEPQALQRTLRRFMDYGVVEDRRGEIPRDADRIARALGLRLGPS